MSTARPEEREARYLVLWITNVDTACLQRARSGHVHAVGRLATLHLVPLHRGSEGQLGASEMRTRSQPSLMSLLPAQWGRPSFTSGNAG